MTRKEYARRWSSERFDSQNGKPTIVPDDVERRSIHEPCWMCGTALGQCKHRKAA